MQASAEHTISTPEQLDALFGEVAEAPQKKEIPYIHTHASPLKTICQNVYSSSKLKVYFFNALAQYIDQNSGNLSQKMPNQIFPVQALYWQHLPIITLMVKNTIWSCRSGNVRHFIKHPATIPGLCPPKKDY